MTGVRSVVHKKYVLKGEEGAFVPVDVDRTLRAALKRLNVEKVRISRQIAALQGALETTDRQGARKAAVRRKRGRRRMSAAARKAASRRMKAYWKSRRASADGSRRARR